MTVGIAAVIPGGVVAVADGRTSKVFENEVVSDLTRKVLCTSTGLTVVLFGVTSVNEQAMTRIRAGHAPASGAEAVAMANAALTEAWGVFSAALGPDVDRTNGGLRSALIVAGVDFNGPYIGAVMVDFQRSQAIGAAYGTYNHMVIGAERFGSSETFVREMNH
jgi:hypothetical protein